MSSSPSVLSLVDRNGHTIAYRAQAAGAGRPTVALVHSLAMDHHFWDPVAARLVDHASVITIDARGHGQSGRGGLPYSCAQMAEDLCAVLDHLGVRRTVVGGASMGGCVALQFAGAHPDRTAGLALIDTTAWYGPTAVEDWEGRAAKALDQGMASLVDFQKSRWFSDAFRAREPGVVDACIATFLANDLQAYAATCRMLGAFDGRALLPGIRVPTRIVVGEEDYAAPVAMAQALHDGIAASVMRVVAGARHLTPLEVPDLVADELLALCTEAGR